MVTQQGQINVTSGHRRLFRAVSDTELADIQAHGGFRLQPGGYEAKLFATTPEDAAAYGRALYLLDQKPFTVVEVALPAALIGEFEQLPLDRRPAVVVRSDQLDALNAMAELLVLPHVPLGEPG